MKLCDVLVERSDKSNVNEKMCTHGLTTLRAFEIG